MQAEKSRPVAYAAAIAEATGAPDSVLHLIEEIMRDEVFHSTLDWQSADEFRDGARKAHKISLANRDFYHADTLWRRAQFRLFSAAEDLKTLQSDAASGSRLVEAQVELEAARIEEAAARVELDEHQLS